MSGIRIKTEEGHYTIKRVPKLPKKGNANWLYVIIGNNIKEFHRWNALKNEWQIITIGNSGDGETFIEAGTNVIITGDGSELSPYIINSSNTLPTGLEAISEGNGIGWRLIGRDSSKTADLGFGSIDFQDNSPYLENDYGPASPYSISFGGGNKLPATSNNFGLHVSIGSQNNVQGYYNNFAFGVFNTINDGYSAVAIGLYNTIDFQPTVGQGLASGLRNSLSSYWATALGTGLISKSVGTTVIGISNTDYSLSEILALDRPLFIIGNGTASTSQDPNIYGTRLTESDAFTVLYNGQVGIDINDFSNNTTGEKLQVNGKIKATDINFTGLSVYADDVSAGTGGLVTGDCYQTATGELRIKL